MRIKFIEIRHMHKLIQLDSGQSNSLSQKGGTRKKSASPIKTRILWANDKWQMANVMTDMYICTN